METTKRWGLLLCVALGVVAVLTVGGVAGAVEDRSHSVQPETPTAQESFDADDVRLTVTVDSDGTAAWTVEYWKQLDDDESEEAFASIESDVEENPEEYVDGFAESMDDTVASAAEETDREMSASGYTVATRTESIPQEYGVLTYQFEWSGFAAVDGDRMEIGDAISGFFLDDQSRLVVGWPSEYSLVDVRPEPGETRSDSVLWRGSETSFVGDEPRVVVSTEPDDSDGLDNGPVDGEEGDGVPLIPVGGGVTGVALLFMLWWLSAADSPMSRTTTALLRLRVTQARSQQQRQRHRTPATTARVRTTMVTPLLSRTTAHRRSSSATKSGSSSC